VIFTGSQGMASEAPVMITPIADIEREARETVRVSIGKLGEDAVPDPDGGAMSEGSAVIQIENVPMLPIVSAASPAEVTEGEAFEVTVTADFPDGFVRDGPLEVSLWLIVSGDVWADSSGINDDDTTLVKVVIDEGETQASLSYATVDDDEAESDGRLTVVVNDRSRSTYFTSESPGDMTRTYVRDNDQPPSVPPVLTITGGAAVDEGEEVVFVVRADRASESGLWINWRLEEHDALDDDFNNQQAGDHEWFIPAGKTESEIRLATLDNDIIGANGAIRARLLEGDGYEVGSPSEAAVELLDEDFNKPPQASAADARIEEAPGAHLEFVVSLSTPPRSEVSLGYTTWDDIAEAGIDYIKTEGELTFAPGETRKTVLVEVLDDEVIVLAETAEVSGDIDLERAETALKRARERLAEFGAAYDVDRARRAVKRAETRLEVARGEARRGSN